ncbi:ribosome silencing factor [Anaerobium acetethylicum]|uniref:Ribosomal silencing factor RsfS n=1 Tax=Anaerobium acetethylicum TaxID=1619234 RepID=A0A1D3TNS6_9FIRM|nr:ribosome silencing factor [Anaerobium acetethylicum]SCP94994.1 ribosome-associated protein [Anaerobium acetethylicum]
MNQSKEMARIACAALADKKAEDIKVIEIGGISALGDYFIIANGTNRNQVQAMIDNVQDDLFKAGHEAKHIEGYNTANWILLDYGDIIVHVFAKEDRSFYDLERIWRDGKEIDVEELLK